MIPTKQQPLVPHQVAEVKLTYKANQKPSTLPKIKSSMDIYRILNQMWSDDMDFVESFNILLLNRRLGVLGFLNLSKGGTASTVVDIKLVFSAALLANASSIVLAHNHPSGYPFPSDTDKKLTKSLVKAGKILKVEVVDHIIMTSSDYYSFADEGILDEEGEE